MLFLSCHLPSFNQDRPGFGECVRNRRKLSKLYDKSCRGKRSVSITGAVRNGDGGEGPRSSTNGSGQTCWTRSTLLGSGVCAGQDL